jgi:hypothetical protein
MHKPTVLIEFIVIMTLSGLDRLTVLLTCKVCLDLKETLGKLVVCKGNRNTWERKHCLLFNVLLRSYCLTELEGIFININWMFVTNEQIKQVKTV